MQHPETGKFWKIRGGKLLIISNIVVLRSRAKIEDLGSGAIHCIRNDRIAYDKMPVYTIENHRYALTRRAVCHNVGPWVCRNAELL